MKSLSTRYNLALWPAALFLFILPFTHTVALRWLSLAIAATIAFLPERTRTTPPIPFKWPLLLWAGMAFLSLTWAIDPGFTLGEIKNEIGGTMLAFLVFYRMTQGEREWQMWNRVLILGFLAISISGVWAYWWARDEWDMGGVHGGVGDYSTYLIMILPFLLLAASRNSLAKFPGNLVWLLLPILLMGGHLTLNRAFWPALITVVAIFVSLDQLRTRSFRFRNKIRAAAIILLVLTISGILGFAQFMASVKDRAALRGADNQILSRAVQSDPRLPIWTFAIAQIRDHPLTGAGFGRGAAQHIFKSKLHNVQLWHAHNIFLDYGVQMGLGGILALTMLFVAISKAYWRLYRSTNSDANLIGATGLAFLCGVIVKNMTDDFFIDQHSLFFWALIGMSLGYGHRCLLQQIPAAPSKNQPIISSS